MKNSVLVGAVLALVGLMTTVVRADNNFSTHSSYVVGNDFNSGSGNFWASGENAVPMRVHTDMDYYTNWQGDTEIYISMQIEGNFVDAGTDNPYLDYLEEHGLHFDGMLLLTEIVVDGDTWEYNNPVDVGFNGVARIFRGTNDDNMPVLDGYFANWVRATGAIPVSTYMTYQEWLEPRPAGIEYDWGIYGSMRLIVTEEFRPIPSPGPAALLGLGSLFCLRRRR